MRKHLIGTILVLAALAACNKEIDTQTPAIVDPVEETPAGKVTLTFKATIGEETRTTYANDKTASWAAGDKISVRVTDGTNFETAEFSTTDGETFTGQVTDGFTTIVSGVYPANENHVFSGGSVQSVYLPESYNLEDADDTGRFIPLIGTIDGENMSFHHFCSAMKVTLTNIPAEATVFTFTANGQQVAGGFTLSGERMELTDQGSNASVQFTFNAGATERSFYIPIPDGTLAANSFVTLSNADEVLFKKSITSSPTFGLNANSKDAIRVLPEVACWTRNEDWTAYYYGTYKTTSGAFYKGIRVEDVSSSYSILRLTDNAFNNTYGGSVAEYLSSDAFAQAVRSISNPYNGDKTCGYTTFTPGTYHVIIFGLDENKKFTGEYNCVEIECPTFTTPEGWSISVVEGDSYPIKYKRPNGVQWQYVTVKASSFADTYYGDVEYLIYTYARSYKSQYEDDPTKRAPLTANYNLGAPANPEGQEYVFVSFGIDEYYMPTGDYFLLDYLFETPTDAYSAWLGKWTAIDNGSTPSTDTWTISKKRANHTYKVTGLFGYTSYEFEIKFNSEDGSLVFPSQIYNTSSTLTYWLVGSSNKAADHQMGEYDIMQASFNGDDTNQATLVGLNPLKRYYTVSYNNSDGSYNGYYKVRYLPTALTRVTE